MQSQGNLGPEQIAFMMQQQQMMMTMMMTQTMNQSQMQIAVDRSTTSNALNASGVLTPKVSSTVSTNVMPTGSRNLRTQVGAEGTLSQPPPAQHIFNPPNPNATMGNFG